MPAIIVTPSELLRFAKTLRERTSRIRFQSRRLTDLVSAARFAWKDDKYLQFNKDLEEVASELSQLLRTADRYADYLDLKANRARKYLDRR